MCVRALFLRAAGSGADGASKPQTEEEIKQALREREHALRLQLKAFVSSAEFNGRSTTDFYGFGKVGVCARGGGGCGAVLGVGWWMAGHVS